MCIVSRAPTKRATKANLAERSNPNIPMRLLQVKQEDLPALALIALPPGLGKEPQGVAIEH